MSPFKASDSEDRGEKSSVEIRKRARKRSIDNRQFLIAISESNIKQVNNLVKRININYKDPDGYSALHWAVETGDIKIINLLLRKGADVHSVNNNHASPIDIAKHMNRQDIVNVLQTSSYNSTDRSIIFETSRANGELRVIQDQEVWMNPIHGSIYQLKLLMLLLHRGLYCQYSFRVGSEIKETKQFDNLILQYTYRNEKVYRLLKTKHNIDESQQITAKSLIDYTGDYSLIKYFHSFQACKKDKLLKDGHIRDFIICTNIDFDMNDLENSNIEIEEIEDEVDDIFDMYSDLKNPTRYKFTNSLARSLQYKLRREKSTDEIEQFLDCLVFAVHQPNEEELDHIIKTEIGSEMGFLNTEIAYNKVLVKMEDLMPNNGDSTFASPEDGKRFFKNLKTDIPIWYNVNNPINSFTGRVNYLKNMNRILTKKHSICIVGMTGVGKSELVRKYIAEYSHEYGNQIVWINAENYRTTCHSFRLLAVNNLNITLRHSQTEEKQISSIVTEVYQFFSKGESLFIFDNAEKYKGTNESDFGMEIFFPNLSNDSIKPHIIVTSRTQQWPKIIETLFLSALKDEEARNHVQKELKLNIDEEKDAIGNLCRRLQYFPLPLQQSLAYINMQNKKLQYAESNFKISNYLERYSSLAQNYYDTKFPEDIDKIIFTACNVTFEAVEEHEHGKHALNLLIIISYFLPDNIPIDLLLIFSKNEEILSFVIALLKEYSIVNVHHRVLSIHRLVQQAMRIKLQKHNQEIKVLKNALKFLKQGEASVNSSNVDHVITLWLHSRKHEELIDDYCHISGQIIKSLRNGIRVDEAHHYAVEILEYLNKYPRNDAANAKRLQYAKLHLAGVYLVQGDNDTALQLFKEIEKLEEKNPTDQIRELLTKGMICVLKRLGRHKEALNYKMKFSKEMRKRYEPEMLIQQSETARALLDENRFIEALLILQQVYPVLRKIYGIQDTKTLFAANNTATCLAKMNRINEALAILQEMSDVQDDYVPKDHPVRLSMKFNLATCFVGLKHFGEATKIFHDLKDAYKEKFGENHPETIQIDLSMAFMQEQQFEHEKALKVYEYAFKKLRMSVGELHPETLKAQNSIANLLIKQDKYEEARKILEDVLNKRVKVLRADHPTTIGTRRMYITVLFKLKMLDKALKCSLESLDISNMAFGQNSVDTFIDISNVSQAYYCMNNFDEALKYSAQLLQAQEAEYGKDHVACQNTLKNITFIQDNKVIADGNWIIKENVEEPPKKNIHQDLLDVIRSRNIDKLEQLLKNKVDINVPDLGGRTLLHHASSDSDELVVGFLIGNGAEVHVTCNTGSTPLHIAVSRAKVKIVELLLMKVKPQRLNDFVDAKTIVYGNTALHIAVEVGNFEIVKLLLEKRATFCAYNYNKKTPLDLCKDKRICKFLTMIGETFDGVATDKAAEAISKLDTLPADELLAVTNARNSRGSTLSQVAILNKRTLVANAIVLMVQRAKNDVFASIRV